MTRFGFFMTSSENDRLSEKSVNLVKPLGPRNGQWRVVLFN